MGRSSLAKSRETPDFARLNLTRGKGLCYAWSKVGNVEYEM
jgi:hypothetical protein